MADRYLIGDRKGTETNFSKMVLRIKANIIAKAAKSESALNKGRLSPVESQMTLKRKYPDERNLLKERHVQRIKWRQKGILLSKEKYLNKGQVPRPKWH